MKKVLLLATAALFSAHLSMAQQVAPQQCEGNCVDVDMNIGPPSHGGPITNPNWSYSHGSTNISPTGFWAWSANSIGEGMNYSGYNFIAGRQYCISYLVTTATHDGNPSDPASAFNIIATNGPVVGMVTWAGGAPIPAPTPPFQVVENKTWNTFLGNGITGQTEWVTVYFTATNNFNNLFIFPSSPGMPPVNVTVSGIRICEINPCQARFSVAIGEYNAPLSTLDILTPFIPAGFYVCQENIIRNGVLVYSGMPISYLAQPGNYTVCVTFCNKETGQRCTKCFDFCIGKWHSPDIAVPVDPSDPGISDIKSLEVPARPAEVVPDHLKENPFEVPVMLVSPNPSKGGDFRISISDKSTIAQVEVYNASGQLIQTTRSNAVNAEMQLKAAPGIYFLKAKLADGKELSSKLVIE